MKNYNYSGVFMEKEAEEILINIQNQNQNLQNIMIQKQALEIQLREIESALEELEKAKDDVFKAVGPILIKSTKEELKKELEEGKEDINLNIKALERQEKKIKEIIKENQEKFQKFLPKPKDKDR